MLMRQLFVMLLGTINLDQDIIYSTSVLIYNLRQAFIKCLDFSSQLVLVKPRRSSQNDRKFVDRDVKPLTNKQTNKQTSNQLSRGTTWSISVFLK